MDNLWQRRSNSSKLSLATSSPNGTRENSKSDSPRTFSATKRFGGETSAHSSKANPFNSLTSSANAAVASPTVGASSAFGLGSGAFASFGSATKTPRTPGASTEFAPLASEKSEKTAAKEEKVRPKGSSSSLETKTSPTTSDHPIKSTWVVWYRPPTSKYSDYEKSTTALVSFSTVEAFWTVYSHLKRPSGLPSVSDYHIFKKGIRPVWEDEENKRGGKWIVRLKKGVADRYWEDLLLAIVGDQFAEAGEEVCGAVLSVRSGEDVLSVWTRIDGGRNIKIRETIKRLLAFPPDTNIVWKSHDDSIAQRSAIDHARQDKGSGTGTHSVKRRDTLAEEPSPETSRTSS
ncbi:hypothetical protein MMC19_003583 [Ptychographa xylographoides]|nr:hypothetical protein [Ptychographa xylographoides]